MIEAHATVLLVSDVQRSLAYYRDRLGFAVESYEADPGHYGFARRDACFVHVVRFPGAAPRPNSAAVPPDLFDVYAYVDDADALHEELKGRGAEILHAPVRQAYGLYELRVRDPDGYVLAFGQPTAA